MSQSELTRLESMARPELIASFAKQKQLTARYQRKLNDLVAAYKDATAGTKKLEVALEKHQDKAAASRKELIDGHKKDLATKAKLSDAIRRRNESLQEEIATLQDRYAEAVARNKEAEGAESSHSATSEVADRLRTKVSLLKEEVVSRDARVVALASKVEVLAADLEMAKVGSKQLAAELEQSISELAASKETNGALKDALRSKEGSVSSSADMMVELKRDAARTKAELAAAASSVATLQAEHDALKDSQAAAAAAAAHKASTAATANARAIEELQNDLSERDKSKASLAAQVKSLSAKLLAAEESASMLTSRADSLQSQHAAEISKLQGRLEVLQNRERGGEIDGSASSSRIPAAAAARIGGVSAAHLKERNLLESQIAELHDELGKKRQENSQQLDSVRTDLRKRSEECSAAIVQVQLLESAASEAEAARARLQTMLTATTQDLEAAAAAAASLETKRSSLEAELSLATSSIKLGEAQRVALDNLVNTLRVTAKEKDESAATLRRNLQDKENELSAKTEHMVTSASELAALRVKHGALSATLESARDEHAAVSATSAKRLAAAMERAETAEALARDKGKALSRRTATFEDREAEAAVAEKRAAAELARAKAALVRAEAELESNADALVKTSETSKVTAAAVADAESKQASLELEIRRLATKEASAREEIDRLADSLGTTTARLRREEANAASNKYTMETQAGQLKALRAERDGLAARNSAARTESGDAVRELSLQAAKAEAALVQAERLASVEQHASEQSALQLMQAEAKLEVLEPELAAAKSERDALQMRVDDLESQAAVGSSAMNVLQAEHAAAVQQAEAAEVRLHSLQTEAAETNVRAEKAEAAASDAQAGKEKAESDHQAAVVEHLLASKKQQQYAAELKKDLQRTLKKGAASVSAVTASSSAGIASPSAFPSSTTSAASSPATNPSPSNAPPLTSMTAPGGYYSAESPPQLNPNEAHQYPDHLEVNFMYLKNVIIKYMTTSSAEAKQLLKVISTVLRFTKAEENKIKAHMDNADSWLPTAITSSFW